MSDGTSPSINLDRVESAFTSKHWEWRFYTAAECPATLCDLLASKLPHILSDSWEQRFWWGGLYINGREVRENVTLSAPCKVEYYEPKFNIEDARKIFPAFSKDFVIFEDGDLVACFKPAKLPCLSSREQRHINLRAYLENYTGGKVHMPSRLDMSTAGVVIVSKSERMHGYLQRTFETRSIQKIYMLGVAGPVDWQERIVEGDIAKHPEHPVLRQVVDRGGKYAKTHFRMVRSAQFSNKRGEKFLGNIIEAAPVTGRTHQIRVHAQSLGLPIVGDNFYGGVPADTLHLVSFSIGFMHPFTQQELQIVLPEKFWPGWLRLK